MDHTETQAASSSCHLLIYCFRLERSRSLASQPPPQQFHQLDDEEDEHLVRLIAERDLLLKTGTYTMSDSIIANLEREIRDITKRKGLVHPPTPLLFALH